MLGALASAGSGLRAAVGLFDSAALRVSRATAVPVRDALPVRASGAAAPRDGDGPPPSLPDDGLVGGMTDLLLARRALQANGSTVRRADEAYRDVLGLLGR